MKHAIQENQLPVLRLLDFLRTNHFLNYQVLSQYEIYRSLKNYYFHQAHLTPLLISEFLLLTLQVFAWEWNS